MLLKLPVLTSFYVSRSPSTPSCLALPPMVSTQTRSPTRTRHEALYVTHQRCRAKNGVRGLTQPSIMIARTASGKQADFGLNDTETAFAVCAPFAAVQAR